MAYYTDFTLNIDFPRNYARKDELLQAMKDLQVFGYMGKVLDNGYSSYEATWYEHEEDMRRISAKFEGILFTLYGSGDDPEDLWVDYYKNGKCQHCPGEIVYADFDPEQMN